MDAAGGGEMRTYDMETHLKELFDRQRTAHDPHLERLIGETEARWGMPLADADLEAVAAAGDVDTAREKRPWGEIQ